MHEQRRVGPDRPARQVGRVEHAEVAALPVLLEAAGHLRVHLLLEGDVVVLAELLVVAGERRQLLLGPRRLLDPRLEGA